MRQRQLGSDGLVTSALGMGCMGLSQGYGPADDDESVRAIRRAAELGVTMFDTAMSYGQGHNERLIGRALAGLPWQVQVATKFGIVRDDGGVHLDGRPEHVRGYCEASLARLGVEVIDLYYLHRVDPQVPIGDTIGAMAGLVAEGKVRHLGVSEVTPDQLEQAAAVHRISAVEFEWSLAWREPEDDIVPAARRLGAGLGALQPTRPRAAHRHADQAGHRPERLPPRRPQVPGHRPGPEPGAGRGAAAHRRRPRADPGPASAGLAACPGPRCGAHPRHPPGSTASSRTLRRPTWSSARTTCAAWRRPCRRAAWAGDRRSFAAVGT